MAANKQHQSKHSIVRRRFRHTAMRLGAVAALMLLVAFLVAALAVTGSYASFPLPAPAKAAIAKVLPRLQRPEPDIRFTTRATDTQPTSPLSAPPSQPAMLPKITPDTRPDAAPVLLPTVTPTPLPTPLPTAVPPTTIPPTQASAAPASVTLTGLTHEWQTWNNCGPATLSMALSYYGYEMGQAQVATYLRPNPEDKNVSPEEIVAFANAQGLAARARFNGDADVLKRLLNQGFPVIVEVWLEPEPNDGFGHYRLLTGYDDEAQRWTAYDSYVGENLVTPEGPYSGIYVPYDLLERQWVIFNRSFMVLYPQEAHAQVEAALAEFADDATMWQRTLERTQGEIKQNPEDAFAWFNRGTALVELAQYEEAAQAYDRAQAIGLPWRMLWYQFGPMEAYYETERYEDLLAAVDRTLATTVNVEELYYWQGAALAALGDVEGARAAWSAALALRAAYPEAEQALASLGQ